MPHNSPAIRSVQPLQWFATYFIGIAALALAVVVLCSLLILASSSASLWTTFTDIFSIALQAMLLITVVVSILAALPCALFFWLAQRFAWHNVLIYLFCGILGSLPTMPVVASMFSSSFFTDPPEVEPKAGELEDYLVMAPLFTGSGAFLGAVFWWRTGRHLRRASA
ncbi:hypothetical protein ACLRDI_14775 [Pseudomonas piscis]|uniref:hypothetical protein n=1 Tax=Pseudomonas piscis TaxID=2614538 RepID=UPI0039A63779